MKAPVQTPYIKIWRLEGIIFCLYPERLIMDLTIARLCVEERLRFCEGESYPCLINMRGLKSVTKEAREYLANEGTLLVKAGALVINSLLTEMIGNIFLSVNKPKVPTRLFLDEAAAISWLKQFTTE